MSSHTNALLAATIAASVGLLSDRALGVELIGEAAAIASDDPALDSVLVDSRQGEPLDESESPELEPISEVSDYQPELADPDADLVPSELTGDLESPVLPTSDESEPAPVARVSRANPRSDRTTSDVADAYKSRNAPRPARFHGIAPGKSNRAELIEAWGEPDRVGTAGGETSGGAVLGYDLEPFQSVEALIEGDMVTVIRVALAEQATVGELTQRLKLTEIEIVDITDPETGELLAVTYPEKGLTLLAKPTSAGTPLSGSSTAAGVSHLVLEPIDQRAFVVRAERRETAEPKAKLQDLATAVELNPVDAHAHWLSARTHLAVGHAADAKRVAEEAVRIEPRNAAYRLTLAQAHAAVGEVDSAVLEMRKVLDDGTAPELVRATALYQMGRMAALGDRNISRKAIDFHNTAISLADGLATSDDDSERRMAKDLLVDAHLAIAEQVARGDFNEKDTSVAQWIGRASGLAEQRIDQDGGGLELRLAVARGALAALAELRPTKDPGPWLEEAQQTAEELLAKNDDALFAARVHWELGEAFQHAVRIEHIRGDPEMALEYGNRAIQELSAGGEPRTTSPAAEHLVGRLYFYLGAVNAVHRDDHTEAVGWYDKGRVILESRSGGSEFVVSRRDGEELVSMGVSYWDQDQRELAVDLTEMGARLMERAVSAGVLEESTLGVPYGNLATMYKTLDNSSKASEYGRLARGVRKEEPKPARVVQRSTASDTTQRPAPRKQSTASSPRTTANPTPPNPAPTQRVSRRLGRPSPRHTMTR